jgi:hypothetical protein
MEQIFLTHTYSWLRPKGVLLMLVPHKVIYNCSTISLPDSAIFVSS